MVSNFVKNTSLLVMISHTYLVFEKKSLLVKKLSKNLDLKMKVGREFMETRLNKSKIILWWISSCALNTKMEENCHHIIGFLMDSAENLGLNMLFFLTWD